MRVLVVEDDPDLAETLRLFFRENLGYEVEVVSTVASASAALRERFFDVMTLDLQLPDSPRADTPAMIPAFNEVCPVIVVTAFDDPELIKAVARAGASRILLKYQLRPDELKAILLRDIETWRTRRRLREILH